MKFNVDGVLKVTSKDGKKWARIDFMGGSVGVMLGHEFVVEGLDDDVRRFTGQIRFGKTGPYFIVEGAE